MVLSGLFILCLFIISLGSEECDFCYSLPDFWLKISICGIIIIIGTIYFSKEFLKFERLIFQIEGQPLLETDEAVEGLPFAGDGMVEADHLIKSPYTKTDCVYYHAIKEEKVNDGWVIIENEAGYTSFYLKDERGRLRIDLENMDSDFSGFKIYPIVRKTPDPRNSEIDGELVLIKEEYEKIKKNLGFNIKKHYRLTEFVLKPKTKIFVYGKVFKKNNQLFLKEAPDYPLIISKKTRDQYVEEFYWGENLVYLRHFLIALGFTILFTGINFFFNLESLTFLVTLLIGNILILGSVFFSIFNRMVTLRNRALNSLANIEVELKRRNDLIPRITEFVKGFAQYEYYQQMNIALKKSLVFMEEISQPKKKNYTPLFFYLIEKTPEIKARQSFKELFKSLIDTEERIAYSREFYNRSVRKYNGLISQFPFLILSFLFGFKKLRFISI